MKIALDIDDVLADSATQLIAYVNQHEDWTLTRDTFASYHLEEVFHCDRETALDIIRRYHKSPYHTSIQPFADAVRLLPEIARKHDVIAVTARHDGIADDTKVLLDRHFPDIKEVFYIYSTLEERRYASKAEVCLLENVDVMIDDSLEHALACADAGLQVLLLTAPWNRHAPEHPRLQRVDNWNELAHALETLHPAQAK